MATHRYDPYLWVHLAGIATVPLWLAISMLGLAVGSPQWPGLELALLAGLGVLPALWMQLGRPFYIFSLLALTLKPTALSDDQRRMLTLFQQWWVRSLAVVSPVLLVWLLWEIYPRAVVASDITPFASLGHFGGLAVAAGSFAMANLFFQVPISVLAVMATSDKRFKRTVPYPLDEVNANFTQVGIPLNRLLPEVLPPDGVVPAVEDIVDQEIVLQKSDAADLEAAVGTELVEAELAAAELIDLEAARSLEWDTTAFEPKMNEAQVWAEALQPSIDPSEVLAHEDVLDAALTTPGDHQGWNNEEIADHLPVSVGVEDDTAAELETVEVESEAQATVDTTVYIPTEFTADDRALTENLDPATAEVAEPAILSLADDMAHLDGLGSSSGDTAINDPTAVEAMVETSDLETSDLTTEVAVEATDIEAYDLETNDITVEATDEATVEAVEVDVVAEVSVSGAQAKAQAEAEAPDDWDHGNDSWDQTAHDWKQDPDWEASVESVKDRAVEVAVVRISDPS